VSSVITKLEELRSLLGAESAVELGGKIVASPRTTEEVAAVTHYANENKLAIEIIGAGTKRSWGNPVNADIQLNTTRLVGVREHSWQDLTATVGAGTPWAVMQKALAVHNQHVALDPLWPETATVGGIIATNDSGALRLKYGSLRDLIIGMTIVLADGTIAKSGGKVVKNVAGYDLHKLMTGAFGTLGVITEVTFRLHPLPKYDKTVTAHAGQAQQLAPLIDAIRKSHILVQAMQIRGDVDGFHLDIELNSHPDACHSQALVEMARAHGQNFEAAADKVWSARELLFKGEATVLKQGVHPSEVCVYADHVEWASAQVEVNSVYQSHGIGFVELRGEPNAVRKLIQSVHSQSPRAGVSTVCAPFDGVDRWGQSPGPIPLMREIKRHFDPNRILNPGRFVGGI
jgi:glycolate oxidase FAD binding subunit